MSVSRETTVWCDGAACLPRHRQTTQTTGREARRKVRLEGWTYRKGRDLCPWCSYRRANEEDKQ